MMSFLAQAPSPELAEGLASRFELLDAPPTWVVVLVVLPLIAGLVWLAYGRRLVTEPGTRVLGALRFVALLLLVFVLFRPALVEERQEVRPAEVVILLDDSASMARTDAWAGEDGGEREAQLGVTGIDPRESTRAELAEAALREKLLPALEERGYEPHLYTFADGWTPIDLGEDSPNSGIAGDTGEPDAPTSLLQARGVATHLGDAVLGTLAANATRHVTGMVVLGDGRNTGGAPVIDASRRASAAGIPVHGLVIGDSRDEVGLSLELVDVPETIMEDDELAVRLRISVQGLGELDEQPRADVRLEELTAPDDASGRIVDEREERPEPGGTRLTLVAPRSEGSASGEARRHFLVRVPPLPGEVQLDDNELRFSVRVTTQTIRVLYVDGYPRWEYRFLKEFLKRGDANISVRCYLGSASPDFPQEASQDLAPLTSLPTTREELLDDYDVVLLGDVNPRRIGRTEAESEAFIDALFAFVEAGGGLGMQAGELDNPRSYAGTPLETLLPIKLDPAGRAGFGSAETPYRPVLENPSRPHPIVRLIPDIEANRRMFEDEDGLAPFYWFYPVERAKAGADVLLSHPFEENRYGRRPLLVTGHHPAGRTLFLAVDSTWRWNWRFRDTWRQRFWKGAVRWLALGRLKSGDRRFTIEPGRTSYGLDERVTIGARVLDEDWDGSTDPELEVRWEDPGGTQHQATLNLEPDRPGSYQGALDVERPGHHRVWIELDGVERTGATFEVTLPSRESSDPTPDPEALAELAGATGGLGVSLGNIDEVLARFPGGEERREPLSARFEDLWDRWLTLLLILGVLSVEWILRKRMDLP